MKKTMTSKKKAKEETEKNNKFDQARSKKSFELKKGFFPFFSALKSPREPPPRGGGPRRGLLLAPVVKHLFSRKSMPALKRQRIFRKWAERPRGKLKSSQVRL